MTETKSTRGSRSSQTAGSCGAASTRSNRTCTARDVLTVTSLLCVSLELKRNLQLLQSQSLSSITAQVNIGCDFYMEAKV
jgi:hypothetical protein